jgi:hypothetical protein
MRGATLDADGKRVVAGCGDNDGADGSSASRRSRMARALDRSKALRRDGHFLAPGEDEFEWSFNTAVTHDPRGFQQRGDTCFRICSEHGGTVGHDHAIADAWLHAAARLDDIQVRAEKQRRDVRTGATPARDQIADGRTSAIIVDGPAEGFGLGANDLGVRALVQGWRVNGREAEECCSTRDTVRSC